MKDSTLALNTIGDLVENNGQVNTFLNNEITGNNVNGCPSCTDATGSLN